MAANPSSDIISISGGRMSTMRSRSGDTYATVDLGAQYFSISEEYATKNKRFVLMSSIDLLIPVLMPLSFSSFFILSFLKKKSYIS